MDVVGAVNSSNLILPAGDVKIGLNDYYVYSNSLVDNMKQLGDVPVKTVGIILGRRSTTLERPKTPTRFNTISSA